MQLRYAIVFVADMERSVQFYRDILGLPLAFASDEWSEFSTGSARLALHKAEGHGDGETTAGRCIPGLSVPDLPALHKRLLELEVPCLQAPTDLHGHLIATYRDPDGLELSLSQQQAQGDSS